jgi:hypothetical protein
VGRNNGSTHAKYCAATFSGAIARRFSRPVACRNAFNPVVRWCIVRCMRIFCRRRSREDEIRKRHALTTARSANIFQNIERILWTFDRYSTLDIEARPCHALCDI